MPSIVRLRLERSQASPWGLRLQGGADFEKALVISHVTEGSPSHASGLRSGDVLLEINGAQCGLMTHKAGQEAIISCGDLVPLTVHRQDSQPPPAPLAWTPTVEAVGAAPVKAGVAGDTYTKTSLAKAPVEEDHWDVRHNVTAKGFQPGGGAPGFRSVSAPVTRPGQENRGPPQLAQCWLCSQNIRGVFLQVKGRPTCVSCFKCAACGAELKNVGHVQTGDKLYCHACANNNTRQQQNNNNNIPQGLASNLARIAGGPQQPGAPPNNNIPQGLASNLARISGGPQQPGGAPPPSDWSQRLNQNTAGSAMNAEDFTKEFMKQLTGGQ